MVTLFGFKFDQIESVVDLEPSIQIAQIVILVYNKGRDIHRFKIPYYSQKLFLQIVKYPDRITCLWKDWRSRGTVLKHQTYLLLAISNKRVLIPLNYVHRVESVVPSLMLYTPAHIYKCAESKLKWLGIYANIPIKFFCVNVNTNMNILLFPCRIN